MMSDMRTAAKKKPVRPVKAKTKSGDETFTVRDLSRNAAALLAACERRGMVRIRSRSGKAYVLQPEAVTPTEAESQRRRDDSIARLLQHHERMKAMGCHGPNLKDKKAMERFNAIVAGEI